MRETDLVDPVRGVMNEALRMQISAFVDGELPDNESELLLRRLSQDAALRQQVAEYLEIGRLLRRDVAVPGTDGLRGRIANALGEEPLAPVETETVVGSRFMTPTSGIAVAATVAVVALIGLNQLDGAGQPDPAEAVAIELAPVYTEPDAADVLSDRPSEALLEYYRRHGDGILTRMANFELLERNLVRTEPDPHLVPAKTDDADDERAAADAEPR